MILSTCNRVEIVAESPDDRLIRDFLCEYHQIPHETISRSISTAFKNADAIRHVFRVTSSLDSMMVGEPQILGQVKEAYRIATDAGTIGMHLSALMNRAFAVAKKVRSRKPGFRSRRFRSAMPRWNSRARSSAISPARPS